MFTGIIETIGSVKEIVKDNDNLHINIESILTPELKIDQSVAHNGICLTVVAIKNNTYTVTAIKETIQKTNISDLKAGQTINLERAMKLGDRLDGHIDQIGVCNNINEENGSWIFTFEYNSDFGNITIEKGSITIDGTSLTVVNSKENEFSVAIIPYTFENTCFKNYKTGTKVNLEFDVIGKYVKRLNDLRK